MDEATRLQYLTAMGIDVWTLRHPPIAVPALPVIEAQEWLDTHEAQQTLLTESETDTRAATLSPNSPVDDTGDAESLDSWNAFYTANAPQQDPSVNVGNNNLPATAASHPPKHFDQATDHAWSELQHQVAICRACALCETRTQTVFGVGNKHARWLLIGEAPGQNEDLQGEPFVGKAGQLLTEMLRAIGLSREEVYIANMIKCRPPNNRDPQAEEVAACNQYLQQQIRLIQPQIILAVGRIAAQNLLNTQQPLTKLRGVQQQLNGIPLIVIHHPAYLLRSLTEKAKAWEDLQFAMSLYQKLEK